MSITKKDLLKFAFIAILFLGLIVTWLAFGESGFIRLFQMEKERQAYEEKIHRLESANQKLLEQINRLRHDKEYIESIARRELGLVKDNEIMYRFSHEQDNGNPIEKENNLKGEKRKDGKF